MSGDQFQSQVSVSEEMISAFVFETAVNTNGVHSMGQNTSASALTKNLIGQDKSRGIRVSYNEEAGYTIDIYLIVTFGVNIPETAWNVQKSVHDGLKNEYGIEPEDVNIHVQGVYAN